MTPSPPITTFGAPTGAGTDFSKFLRNLTSASTLTIEPDNATSTFMVAPLYAFERRLTPYSKPDSQQGRTLQHYRPSQPSAGYSAPSPDTPSTPLSASANIVASACLRAPPAN